MTPQTHYELASELQEIQQEMQELLDRAQTLLQGAPQITLNRAESYWMAHIRMALSNSHSYLGGSMVTMEDTIGELEADPQEDE